MVDNARTHTAEDFIVYIWKINRYQGPRGKNLAYQREEIPFRKPSGQKTKSLPIIVKVSNISVSNNYELRDLVIQYPSVQKFERI